MLENNGHQLYQVQTFATFSACPTLHIFLQVWQNFQMLYEKFLDTQAYFYHYISPRRQNTFATVLFYDAYEYVPVILTI